MNDWIGAENVSLTWTDIQGKALELKQGASQAVFTASKGWLEKFLKTTQLSLQRRITFSQKMHQNQVPKVSGFIMKIPVGNMEDTPVMRYCTPELIIEQNPMKALHTIKEQQHYILPKGSTKFWVMRESSR